VISDGTDEANKKTVRRIDFSIRRMIARFSHAYCFHVTEALHRFSSWEDSGSASAFALWTHRLTSVSRVLCIALAIVVAIDPWAVTSSGF
jgi:hypothetical protein